MPRIVSYSAAGQGENVVGSILGTRVLRVEDPRFITTGGLYVDDLRIDGDVPFAGAAVVHYVRSPVAHGVITAIDTAEAEAMPAVIAVFTAADLELEPVPARFNPAVARPLLAAERVRYVGEPVAVVVAANAAAAADAADTVVVDYDLLDACIDPLAALDGDVLLYDAPGSNVVADSTALGMPGLSDGDFFAGCDVVVSGRFINQRIAPCPLETRSAAAAWIDDRLIVWMSTQHAQGARDHIASVNGLDAAAVRVVTPDVGGGFGAKITPYAEELLLGRLARELDRPVAWLETRSESMVNLGHGRAQLHDVTIGGTRDGRVTHYRLDILQDAGASAEVGAVLGLGMTRPMASGVYDIANIECRARAVVTNTPPVVAFRGAGRPEATAAIERAMDLFAAELGGDPAEIRRRNLIAPFSEPHATAIGQTYDVGDYVGALDRVLAATGYEELRAEQRRRRETGERTLLGIGVSVYVEITNSIPGNETATIDVAADGSAVVYTGTSSHGQGHETAWAMIAAEHTGLPISAIRVVWGDTDLVPTGGGTLGSRSLQIGGAAVGLAAADLVDIARRVAAERLEADVADVVLDKDGGRFHVVGTPAVTLTWADVASASLDQGASLAATSTFEWKVATFPFGAHVAVVEVDGETGHVRLVRHVACDDAGRIVNPLLVEGQLHGGIASGAAQALMEEVCFDEHGNPITSNLADYAMISAAELPSFELVPMETPTPVNPLGAKGVGESGTIGSTPAVQSAVVDALAHLGVRHIDMPTTPERVWRAIRDATRTD
jgi:aerobic carbon-monoxide dehydrogenase large subunit